MNASRRLRGAAPRPSSPAASSSSVYSGLPSLRAYSRPTRWSSGSAPRMSASASPSSSRSNGSSSIRRARSSRSSSASSGRSAWRRWSSSVLYVSSRRSRSWRSERDRKATNDRVERSAQCMSSRISTTGAGWLRMSSSSSTASNSRSWPVADRAFRPPRRRHRSRAGSIASCARLPALSASNAGWRSRTSGRSALSSGAYGQLAVGLLDALAAQTRASVGPRQKPRAAARARRRAASYRRPSHRRAGRGRTGRRWPPGRRAVAPKARRPGRRSGCWSASMSCPKYRLNPARSPFRRCALRSRALRALWASSCARLAARNSLNWGCIPRSSRSLAT